MTTSGGVIQSLSASQAEEFDPEQVGGCPRRWYYHRVQRLPLPEREDSKVDGDAGHALFAMHYRGQPFPKRHRMLKAVRGAIAKGELPPPAPGQLIESRFNGQPTAARLPLRTSTTLWLGGVPWDGYVDLRFHRVEKFGLLSGPSPRGPGGVITVLDHKFSSDIHTYAKSDLLATVQMPIYALDSLRIWPDAQHVELVHHYVSRRGVDSFIRRQLVTVEQIRQRGEEITGLVKRMQTAAAASSADDVPANRKSCHTWSGCPFQSRCSAFKEKPKMDLNPEEMEWLNVVGGGEVAKPKEEKPRCELCGAVSDHAHGDCPSLTKPPATGPEADRATELEIASAAGAMDPAEFEHHGCGGAMQPADDDPFAVFAPQASVPQEQPTPPVAEAPKPTDGAKCPDCHHPAHPGAACTGKRGRGACRCGAQGAVEKSQDAAPTVGPAPDPAYIEAADRRLAAHLATCVQNDAGKWLCMEGCTASGTAQRSTHSEHPRGHEAELKNDPIRLALCRLMDRLGFDSAASLHDPTVTIDDLSNMIFAGVREEENRSVKGAEERVSADLARERDMHRRTLGELDASERGLKAARAELERLRSQTIPPSVAAGWTGTLQVNVNLGPETLALLQRLLGVKS